MSDSDFLWGFIAPLVAVGIAIGFVMFVGLPWLWDLIATHVRLA